MALKKVIASFLLATPTVWAHGKEDLMLGPIERRDLQHCHKEFTEESFMKRTIEIHGKEMARLRRDIGIDTEDLDTPEIHKRSYITVSQINHKSNKTVTMKTDPQTLFADAGACIMMPVVDQGPLYVQGEQVRKDNTENQGGLKMALAIQVVDYKTCQPVPNAFVDIWSSNSTGMYVGVQGYPGMGDPNDASILKGTALRGIQPTDDHGIATFDTLLPGHYEGRATHIHSIVYLGATKQPNNTITGGKAAFVGQIYFDQPLITAVNLLNPYVTNKMGIMLNTNDFLFMMGANGDDPMVRYAQVGPELKDGLFSWIRFGINTASVQNVSPAAWMTPSGGVMNPNGPVAKMNGGGFGGFGGGTTKGTGKTKGKGKTRKMRARAMEEQEIEE